MDMRVTMKGSFVSTGGIYSVVDDVIISALKNAGINSFKDMNNVRNAIFNCTDNESKEILINLMNRYDYDGDCTICIDGEETNLSIYRLIDLLSLITVKDGEMYYKPHHLQYLSIRDIQDILLLMKYLENNKTKLLDFYHEDEYI